MCLVAPVWETQPWYPLLFHLSVDFPRLFPTDPGLLSKEGLRHPLPQLQLAGWLVSANATLQWEFQTRLRDSLVSAWRNQTSSSYESAWRLWGSWCSQQEIDPFSASVQHVVNFLASLFADGKEYRTINVYRCALSMTLPKVEGLNVGQHPVVGQVMKGIFQRKPPLPRYSRYSATWDVSKVLIFIS